MNEHELKEIEDQMAELAKRKSDILAKNRKADLDICRDLVRRYGFTATELGVTSRAPSAGQRTAGIPKYVNPLNAKDTWTGRGRKPEWFAVAISNGAPEESLRIRAD